MVWKAVGAPELSGCRLPGGLPPGPATTEVLSVFRDAHVGSVPWHRGPGACNLGQDHRVRGHAPRKAYSDLICSTVSEKPECVS